MMRIQPQRNYWPTYGWEESSPLAQGMDPDLLSQLQAYGDAGTPSIHGIVVVRHGYIVWERYHHGFHRGSYHSINSVTKSVVSALLSRVTDMSAAAFAERTLFQPLGMDVAGAGCAIREGRHGPHTSNPFGLWGDDPADYAWMVDRQGLHLGGFGLHLTLRAMAKFGYLYLNGGRWEETIIVPPDYVQSSTQPQNTGAGAPYGYLWWAPRHKLDPSAFFASGYGGQYIDVLPALDVVIAIACSLDQGPVETHGRMVSQLVAAAILEGC